MKRILLLVAGSILLSSSQWIGFAQSFASTKLAKLAPPTNVRVEAGENAVRVSWDASPDEANYELTGYTIYFDTKSSVLLSPESLLYTVQLGKSVHEYVVRGLENGRQYFFHLRSRQRDGGLSAAALPEKATAPEHEGKNYGVSMFDEDASGPPGNSAYGWNSENGQGIPCYQSVTQNGRDVNILMMELHSSNAKSVLISPSESDLTKAWALRNETLIADIGTSWVVEDLLPDSAFTTTAEIKKGHVYVLKTHDSYYVKLRVDSIDEVKLLLPAGARRRDVDVNRITFTYSSQLGQSCEQFLTGTR